MFRISEAQAKLQLKVVVDEEIISQVQQSIQVMILQYGSMVNTVISMRQITCNKFIEILQNAKIGVAIYSLCEIACKENPGVASHLGKNWSVRKNHKLRYVIEILRNHSQVKEIGSNPLVFQWIEGEETKILSDQCDVRDATFKSENIGEGIVMAEFENENQNENKTTSHESHESHRNSETEAKNPVMVTCSKCGKTGNAWDMRIHLQNCKGPET